MGAVEKRTIDLAAEQASFIDAKVETGEYGSVSDVVRAGIEALQQHDAAIERWLREEVVPTYKRMIANPESAIPAADAFASLRARYESRVPKAK